MSDLVAAADLDQLIPEVAALIVEGLSLDMAPDEIEPDGAPCGETFALDSINVRETLRSIPRHPGFQFCSGGEQNPLIFASLRTQCAHFAKDLTK